MLGYYQGFTLSSTVPTKAGTDQWVYIQSRPSPDLNWDGPMSINPVLVRPDPDQSWDGPMGVGPVRSSDLKTGPMWIPVNLTGIHTV